MLRPKTFLLASFVLLLVIAPVCAAEDDDSGTSGGTSTTGTSSFLLISLLVLIVIVVAVLALSALWIVLGIWVAFDAKNRGMSSPVLWALLVIFLGLIPLIIYMLLRPPGDVVPCGHCGKKRRQTLPSCPHCNAPTQFAYGALPPYPLYPTYR